MTGSKPLALVGLGLILYALLMSACGGKTPPNGPSALTITNLSNFPPGAVGDFYQEGLVATGGQQPYTWTIDSGALPAGLSLTTSGVISGTPTTAGMSSFTVRVTDSQLPVKAYQTASTTLTINSALSFSATTLSPAVIAVAYSGMVAASGGLIPYTYSLAQGSLPLPAGLTLSASGTISGTPTGPIGTFPFTVQVTDKFPTTATANFSITVTGKIQGNYAFSFNGYNQQGQAFYMVGSFVADGNGNITSGVFDRNGNDSIGAMMEVPITAGNGATGQCPASGPPTGTGSVYCVGRSGVTNGNNLGTIVIASALGTYSFSVSVSLTADSRLILADPSNPGQWGSGVLRSQGQSLSGITLASSNFAFGLSGVLFGGNRYGGAGFFITDANGNISSTSCSTPPCGEADLNDNGTVQSAVALTGNVSSVDPATGRGTATFTIGSNTADYAFYVVPASTGRIGNQLVAVQTDTSNPSNGVPVTLASMAQRSQVAGGGFTSKSLNATRGGNPNGAVFQLNAVSNSGGTPVPDISLGLGNFDGQGSITSYTFDENNGGVLTTPSQNNYTGTYTVDSSNPQSGRV